MLLLVLVVAARSKARSIQPQHRQRGHYENHRHPDELLIPQRKSGPQATSSLGSGLFDEGNQLGRDKRGDGHT
jgi:hypothetical protein